MALRSPFRLGLTVVSLWPFLPIAARAPLYGRLLLELCLDGRVPAGRKALLRDCQRATTLIPDKVLPGLFVRRGRRSVESLSPP